jgi:hypothetical protein
MKLADILLFEKPSVNLVVIQSKGQYRVDPNPEHTAEDFRNAWTDDLSQARVFKEKAARRFLQRRAEIARSRMAYHEDPKIVRVELDEHGRPFIPGAAEPEKKPGLLGRFRRSS